MHITIEYLTKLNKSGIINMSRICYLANLSYKTISTKIRRSTELTDHEASQLKPVIEAVSKAIKQPKYLTPLLQNKAKSLDN